MICRVNQYAKRRAYLDGEPLGAEGPATAYTEGDGVCFTGREHRAASLEHIRVLRSYAQLPSGSVRDGPSYAG